MSLSRPPPNRVPSSIDLESDVATRYSSGAARVEPALCCPTNTYDAEMLAKLPAEIVEKDYGCGDPTVHARPGDVALDLGSGSGKVCYLLSQRVGSYGRVIGVDVNDDMLALARKYEPEMAARLGWRNVQFRKGRIQDLALDLEAADRWLAAHPAVSVAAIQAFEAECEALRRSSPLVHDGEVDLVVSNCVLNLVRPEHKVSLFREMHRVLRTGGRAVISDIVCDEEPTPATLGDPSMWSGCIAGAFREDRFLAAFEAAGFYGVEIVARPDEPWRVVDGVEYRSITVRAWKGKEGPCLERHQAVIYRGPWRTVSDDDGHTFARGARAAVCDKTYCLLTDPRGPYAGHFLAVPPAVDIPLADARPFVCHGSDLRAPQVSKLGRSPDAPESASGCGPTPGCC